MRAYFIAADEVEWDYAPLGYNGLTGNPFGDTEKTYLGDAPDRVGPVHLKAVFRAYTDATFAVRAPPPPGDESLGILGPVIRAEVGDTIHVMFRNNARYNFSMHAHGVFYDKSSEGAATADGTGATADDSVPPGGTYNYTWEVPERAGPAEMDGSSVLWTYHSHVDEAGDTNAGLIGPIVISRRGELGPSGLPAGVDREAFALFTIFNEMRSPYLWDNIGRFVENKSAVEYEMALGGGGDEGGGAFAESELLHTVNGFAFGNGPGFTMRVGEHVRWYVIGLGTEADLHTPHWHGNTLTMMGMRMDMVELLPMSMKVLDMEPDNPGIWQFHCHVNDHLDAGMYTTYEVRA
jgi:FtsP/CotA-like multicopper oxidase with cupredoxin domain